jgi:hypothetical protein
MFKYNRLYSESIIEPLPDLHDNMGIFEHSWTDNDNAHKEEYISSHRNMEKCSSQCTSI